LQHDPSEQKDLAGQYPEKYQELVTLWNNYARENGVIFPEWKTDR